MRRSLFAFGGLAVLAGAISTSAQAMIGAGSAAVADSWSRAAPVERAQYYSFDGVDYCWYDEGWQGPGWYWCGYDWIEGYGWGGPYNWNGWGGGSYWWRRHPGHDHDHGIYHEGPPRHVPLGGSNDHERREGGPVYQNHGAGPLPHGALGGPPIQNYSTGPAHEFSSPGPAYGGQNLSGYGGGGNFHGSFGGGGGFGGGGAWSGGGRGGGGGGHR